MDERRRRLDEAIERVKGELAEIGYPLSCAGIGCNGCCRGAVQVLPAELPSLFAAMDEDAWQRVADVAVALGNEPETTMCPLLDPKTGGCSVWDVRPAVCRTYGVVTPAEWCWPEKVGLRDVGRPMPLVELLKTLFGMTADAVVVLGDELVAQLRRFDPAAHLPPTSEKYRSTYCQDRAMGVLTNCPSCTPDGGGCDQRYYSDEQCPVIAAYFAHHDKQP